MAYDSLTRRRFLQGAGSTVALGAMGSVLPWSVLRAADLPSAGEADWPRYGYDLHNTRFNVKEKTLGLKNVDRLKVKWQFETIDHWPVQTTPTVIGDTLFFGAGGWYYALESASGKLKWKFGTGLADEASQSTQNKATRSSCQYVNGKIYFGDGWGIVHCLDAATGKEIWKTPMETDRRMGASMRYSPVVYNGKVMVGDIGRDPKIACLDAETGSVRWSWRVAQNIPREANNGVGPLWTSGAVDEKENIAYNVTGDPKAFMPPGPVLYSDSIVAHEFDTGEFLWGFQPHPQDAQDYDFDAHPVIFDAEAPPRAHGDRRFCVAAGSKGGIFCLNRYTGQLYWKVMLGQPSGGSGPQTDAIAFAYNKVFVKYGSPTSVPSSAVTAALNAYNGDIEWMTPNPYLSESPLAVANGVIYQGFNVGKKMEALDAMTGRRIWEHALPSDFRGGASIANGALYMSNGESQGTIEGAEKRPYPYSVYCFTIDGK